MEEAGWGGGQGLVVGGHPLGLAEPGMGKDYDQCGLIKSSWVKDRMLTQLGRPRLGLTSSAACHTSAFHLCLAF